MWGYPTTVELSWTNSYILLLYLEDKNLWAANGSVYAISGSAYLWKSSVSLLYNTGQCQ